MGVVYFSITPTFEPSRYCKCWIVCFHYRFLLIRLYYLRKTGIKQGGYKNSKNCKDKCKENFMAYGHEFIYNKNRNVVL